MKKYLGVKLIEADVITRGEYNIFRGWTIPENENPADEGYLVKYSDDYVSWSPKKVFEKAYMPLGDPSGTRIVEDDVNNFVVNSNISKFGDKTTVVHATLRNGFIITEASSCVDTINFDMKIGEEICLGKIKDKVWGLLGFLLQCGKSGVK